MSTSNDSGESQLQALHAVHAEFVRLEEAMCGGRRPVSGAAGLLVHSAVHGGAVTEAAARDVAARVHVPAWLRPTAGENRWIVAVSIAVAIGLQVALPDRLTLINRWLMPALELVLLAALVVATPKRFNRESRLVRTGSLALSGLVTLANGWSAVLLVLGLIGGREGEDAGPLLSTGASIWLTNVIAFALWYWQFDRGGPVARANASTLLPDFQFVQMSTPGLADPEWEPTFVDYLYLSFTNATAFSPTDTLPLTRWAKLTMLAQSLVSLVTVALVIARAVNILK